MGIPIYSLEHFVAAYVIGDFSARGIPFERSVAEDLTAAGVPARADLWVQLPDGREMNYDTVAWWQGYLLLLEAKCVKTEFSGADDFNTRKAVEESIDQLVRRRDSLGDFWSALRGATPELQLPVGPPPRDRVLCISVSNSMRFNGLERDGVICTDDLCLQAYFGDARTPVYQRDGNFNAIVGYVRNRDHDRMEPTGLIGYLRSPPQVRSLAPDVKVRFRAITGLPTDEKVIAVPTYSYTGSMGSIVKSLRGSMRL
jgi:hypothetical protein